jgi:hypothetical protein
MKTLQESVDTLLSTPAKESQAELLREINRLLLRKYMIRIDDSFRLYPIEVEAYYYHEAHFPDTTVHRNILQKNRFGKLYFHRAGRAKHTAFLYLRGGVDVCLSSGEYYLGILLRSAWINAEDKPVCGPGLLARRIAGHILGTAPAAIGAKERPLIESKEDEPALFPAINDCRDKDSPLLCACRYGIKAANHPEFSRFPLRSLIEPDKPAHPFRDKKKLAAAYLFPEKP